MTWHKISALHEKAEGIVFFFRTEDSLLQLDVEIWKHQVKASLSGLKMYNIFGFGGVLKIFLCYFFAVWKSPPHKLNQIPTRNQVFYEPSLALISFSVNELILVSSFWPLSTT